MLKLIDKVKQTLSTHTCPECGEWTSCNLEKGGLISKCWCNKVEIKRPINGQSCLCKSCLIKEESL